MRHQYQLQAIEASRLGEADRAEIVRMCNEAYEEDISHLFSAYDADLHVLARCGPALAGHGMIVTRWLQVGCGPLLRTAYVELVATLAGHRSRGIGAGIMRKLAEQATLDEYDLAALCPADTGIYGHLGWEYWQGPRGRRQGPEPPTHLTEWVLTPEERVMILRLPRTPPLDMTQSLSAEWRAGGELW